MSKILAEWLQYAYDALNAIEDAGDQDVMTVPPKELVTMGWRLNDILKHTTEVLEQIKTRLRQEAAKMPKGQIENQRFKSDGPYSCLVIPEPSTVDLKETTDIPKLKADLGSNFTVYFEEIVKYKPVRNFQELVVKAPPAEQTLLFEAIDQNQRKARVSFTDKIAKDKE